MLYQVAQSLVQLSFDYEWRSHTLSEPFHSVDYRPQNVVLANKERCPRSQEVPACTSPRLLLLQKPKLLDVGGGGQKRGTTLHKTLCCQLVYLSLLYVDSLEHLLLGFCIGLYISTWMAVKGEGKERKPKTSGSICFCPAHLIPPLCRRKGTVHLPSLWKSPHLSSQSSCIPLPPGISTGCRGTAIRE